jgi:hypothetical protein
MLLIVVAGMIAGLPSAWGKGEELPAPQPLQLEVASGDTLWSLAQTYGDPRLDLREIVWRIRKENSMSSPSLQPGMKLIIPTQCLP